MDALARLTPALSDRSASSASSGPAAWPRSFLAEIKTTAALQHSHVLPLFDSGSADGLLYYVMPFVEGETLRHRLERERQLPVANTAVRLTASDARRITTS